MRFDDRASPFVPGDPRRFARHQLNGRVDRVPGGQGCRNERECVGQGRAKLGAASMGTRRRIKCRSRRANERSHDGETRPRDNKCDTEGDDCERHETYHRLARGE